jgi:hypothetical protein
LIDNFEPAEGCSLRRSTLYNYYLHHCTEQKIEPVNPASFGKLIRSVFLGLRTRRLGTRGNSKYHYYGIRVKVTSPLNQIADDTALAIRNHPLSLSPTGSPQPPSHHHHHHHHHNNNHNSNHHHNSNGTTVLTVNANGMNGATPNKKIKHSMNNNNQQHYESVEYKPIITNVLGGGGEQLLHISSQQQNNNNQSLLQATINSNMNIPCKFFFNHHHYLLKILFNF